MSFRPRKPKTLTTRPVTYWNGRPCPCTRVLVTVGAPPDRQVPLAWWAGMEGTERRAVEVRAPGQPPYYLDDENGEGWSKVTVGKGLPNHGHRAIWPERVIRDLAPNEYPPVFKVPSLEEQYAMRRTAQERLAAYRAEHPETGPSAP